MPCLDNDRGMTPVIGFTLITAIVIASSAVAFTVVSGYGLKDPVIANIDIESYNSSNQEVVLIHRGGESFDVSEISIIISVNGETLTNNLINLPVTGTPYGFKHSLGGVLWGSPANHSHDNIWDPGDTGEFNIAASNNTQLHPGDQLKVSIVHNPSKTIISSPTRRI